MSATSRLSRAGIAGRWSEELRSEGLRKFGGVVSPRVWLSQSLNDTPARRAAASPVLSGTVRVSTGECAAGFLARCLSGQVTMALPRGITLELVESRQTANLARREADMALRHEPPASGDFYISKAGTFACAVYGCRGADAAAWVTYTEEQTHYAPARWVQRLVEETDKLLQLATDLKAQVDKSTKDTLSIQVIKKADEIEKLAHSMKDQMKS